TDGAARAMSNGSTTARSRGALASTGSAPDVPALMVTRAGPPGTASAPARRKRTPLDDCAGRKIDSSARAIGSAVTPAGNPAAETGNASVRKDPVRSTSTTTRRLAPAATVTELGSSDTIRTAFCSTAIATVALALKDPFVAVTVN